MKHDWVYAVLQDLSHYARLNELPELHKSLEETLKVNKRVGEASGHIEASTNQMQP
jgi:hypothetical protein